jgi:ABC-2 type transport system permease protein
MTTLPSSVNAAANSARDEVLSPGRWMTLRRAVASELIKLRTVTSHVWLLAVATAFTLLLGPIQSIGELVASPADPVGDGAEAVSLALVGSTTAAILLGILGVLVVTGEYVPRTIRTTFMLVPQRGHVVVAKAVALAVTTALLSVPAVAAAVTGSLLILARNDLDVGWGSTPVLRVAAVMVWYLVGWGVLGLAAGWVTRSKIGGAALLLGVMLVLGPVLALVPGRAGEVLVGVLPSSVGGAMISTHSSTTLGSPAVGFWLWTGYLVLATAGSVRVVTRRDA